MQLIRSNVSSKLECLKMYKVEKRRLAARDESGLNGCKRCGENKFSGFKEPQQGIKYCPTCRAKCKFQDSNIAHVCHADISGYCSGNGVGGSGFCSTHYSKGPKGCKRCGGKKKRGDFGPYCFNCKPKCKNDAHVCDAGITNIRQGKGRNKSGLCKECFDKRKLNKGS